MRCHTLKCFCDALHRRRRGSHFVKPRLLSNDLSQPRIFCAGANLKERNGMTDAQWMAQHALFEQMIMALMDCPVPVIAAINGASYAGGFEMTLGCDFVYASKTARFALTEVTLGIMPGACGTQNLPRAVGLRRAKEIILTGEPISAEQAYEYGIVNKLCEPKNLLDDAFTTAQKICDNAPIGHPMVQL